MHFLTLLAALVGLASAAPMSPANPEGLDDNSLYVTFYDVAGPLNAAGRPTVVEHWGLLGHTNAANGHKNVIYEYGYLKSTPSPVPAGQSVIYGPDIVAGSIYTTFLTAPTDKLRGLLKIGVLADERTWEAAVQTETVAANRNPRIQKYSKTWVASVIGTLMDKKAITFSRSTLTDEHVVAAISAWIDDIVRRDPRGVTIGTIAM